MDLANTAASLLDAEEDIVGPLEAFPGVFDLLLIKLLLQVIIPLLQRDFAGLAGVNLVV